jgi:hypothetical protein
VTTTNWCRPAYFEDFGTKRDEGVRQVRLCVNETWFHRLWSELLKEFDSQQKCCTKRTKGLVPSIRTAWWSDFMNECLHWKSETSRQKFKSFSSTEDPTMVGEPRLNTADVRHLSSEKKQNKINSGLLTPNSLFSCSWILDLQMIYADQMCSIANCAVINDRKRYSIINTKIFPRFLFAIHVSEMATQNIDQLNIPKPFSVERLQNIRHSKFTHHFDWN